MMKLAFIFSVVFAIILFFEYFLTGKIEINSHSEFNAKRASTHHRYLTLHPRIVGSNHYEKCVVYIRDFLKNISFSSRIPFEFVIEDCEYVSNEINSIHSQISGIKNIIIRFPGKNLDLKPLTLTSHLDSHNVGPSAYDNAINAAMFLELITCLSNRSVQLEYNVTFLITGSEEFGLHGSQSFVSKYKPNGHIMNFDSLGTGRPFGLLIKTWASSSVIKAWSKIPGAISATFSNDVFKTGIIASSSDLVPFSENGVTGAEFVFFGNPATYHTKYDEIGNENDIYTSGRLILKLFEVFKSDKNEEPYISIGISPISISMSQKHVNTLILVFISFILLLERHSISLSLMKSLMKFFVSSFITLIIVFSFSYILYCINPSSFAFSSVFAAIMLTLFSFFIFSQIVECFSIKTSDFIFIRAVLNIILSSVLFGTDSSVIFGFSLFIILIQVSFKNSKCLSLILSFIVLLFNSFVYYVTFRTFLRYGPNLPGIIPDFCSMFLSFVYSISIYLIFTSFINFEKSYKKAYLFFSAIIFLVFLFLPIPYSSNYLIKGQYSHYQYENGSSLLSFSPESQYRSINHLKKITHNHSLQMNMQLNIIPKPKLGLYQMKNHNVNHPKVNITTHYIEKNQREVTFFIPNIQPRPDSITFVLYCKDKPCISKIQSSINPSHIIIENDYKVLFRLMNTYISINTCINSTKQIRAQVVYSWNNHSNELSQFKNMFPFYVTQFAKMRYITDTCYIQEYLI